MIIDVNESFQIACPFNNFAPCKGNKCMAWKWESGSDPDRTRVIGRDSYIVLIDEIKALMAQGKKLVAVKDYKDLTDQSLKIAKETVEGWIPYMTYEEYLKSHGINPIPQMGSCSLIKKD